MIRLTFNILVLGFIALLVVPSLVPQDEAVGTAMVTEDTQDGLGAGTGTLAGVVFDEAAGFCQNQPAICASGVALAIATAERAQRGFAIARNMLAAPEEPVDPIETGGI